MVFFHGKKALKYAERQVIIYGSISELLESKKLCKKTEYRELIRIHQEARVYNIGRVFVLLFFFF